MLYVLYGTYGRFEILVLVERRNFLKNENREASLLMENPIPGFQRGNQKFCFLNLTLEVEMDRVTYHLHSEFSEKAEMGEAIDTIELERNQRRTA